MFKSTVLQVILASILLVGCSVKQPEPRVIYEKVEINHPDLPRDPIECPKPNYVLIEYKGSQLVAEPVKDKLDRIICEHDKLRYTKQLLNTIVYYEEVTK